MPRLASFLALFSAFFSFAVLVGAFLTCFFLSIPLLMVISPLYGCGVISADQHYTPGLKKMESRSDEKTGFRL